MNQSTEPSRSRAQRRAAWVNDPRFDWARTPRMRRRLVIAMIAIIALEVVMLLVGGAYFSEDPITAVVMMASFVPLLAGFGFCFFTLKKSTRGVEELEPEQLDERQMQIRGLVYAQAYRIGATLVIFLLVAALSWSIIAETYPPELVLSVVMLVIFHLTLLLPTLVAAWHQRL